MNKYKKEARAAQKARRQFLSCESKRRYPCEDKARVDLPAGQSAYSCQLCDGWHRFSERNPGERTRMRRG